MSDQLKQALISIINNKGFSVTTKSDVRYYYAHLSLKEPARFPLDNHYSVK